MNQHQGDVVIIPGTWQGEVVQALGFCAEVDDIDYYIGIIFKPITSFGEVGTILEYD